VAQERCDRGHKRTQTMGNRVEQVSSAVLAAISTQVCLIRSGWRFSCCCLDHDDTVDIWRSGSATYEAVLYEFRRRASARRRDDPVVRSPTTRRATTSVAAYTNSFRSLNNKTRSTNSDPRHRLLGREPSAARVIDSDVPLCLRSRHEITEDGYGMNQIFAAC